MADGSDHKPLKGLFHETSGIPTMASACIQRWALTLSAYNYEIKFKAGLENTNAGLLSRLPLPETPLHVPEPGQTVLQMNTMDSSVVTAAHVKSWTAKDPVLALVQEAILQGKTIANSDDFKPYKLLQTELSIHDGCLLWDTRVIVPPPGRAAMIDQLHESHPGICKTKSLARSYVWWPFLNKDLEAKVKAYDICQQSRPPDQPVSMHP